MKKRPDSENTTATTESQHTTDFVGDGDSRPEIEHSNREDAGDLIQQTAGSCASENGGDMTEHKKDNVQSNPGQLVQASGNGVITAQEDQEGHEDVYYMGADGTALVDVKFVESDIPKATDKKITTWLEKEAPSQKGSTTEMINKGVAMAKALVQDSNKLLSFAAKNFAQRAIIIGAICLKLKDLVRKDGKSWSPFATENLGFLAERNREKFMKLARRTDCHQYTYLGVDRLDMLCTATQKSEDKDPIGALLVKYGIQFEQESDQSLADFKKKVDAAIASERLQKHNMRIDFAKVESSINVSIEFDKGFIRRLKDVQDSGGNPQALLEKLIANKGKDDPEESAEKRLQDFNTLSTRLIKTIDFLIDKAEHLDEIDEETFSTVFQKLEELRAKAGFSVPESESN